MNAWTKASWTTSRASSGDPMAWAIVLNSRSWYFRTSSPNAAVWPARVSSISRSSSLTAFSGLDAGKSGKVPAFVARTCAARRHRPPRCSSWGGGQQLSNSCDENTYLLNLAANRRRQNQKTRHAHPPKSGECASRRISSYQKDAGTANLPARRRGSAFPRLISRQPPLLRRQSAARPRRFLPRWRRRPG